MDGEPLDRQLATDASFYPQFEDDVQRLNHLARTAVALSGDASVQKETDAAIRKARDDHRFFKATESQIAGLVAEISARTANIFAEDASGSARPDGDDDLDRAALIQQLDSAKDALADAEESLKKSVAAQERLVRQILSEHDHIQQLLRGASHATDRQFDVMAFPRNANAKTNVLQISGGAGTGKTLCLLAKLIQDTRGSRQLGLLPEAPKRGLFVCFNKALHVHVAELLAAIPDVRDSIEVVHFDQFVNQLVRNTPSDEFAHLAPFAASSRFPQVTRASAGRFWRVVYDEDVEALIVSAMRAVGRAHPSQAQEYYLDAESPQNLQWMADEIAWLEARYEDPEEAAGLYLDAVRTGRGKVHQPSAAIRSVILEVWAAVRRLLEEECWYTVEQAVKRLLKDPDLPRYDAIAIDEAQDLTVASVKLLVRMRRDEQSRVYICADENQKIYKRDFTWSELDAGIHGYTIRLDENKRNSPAIQAFANRLLGAPSKKTDANDLVLVGEWSEEAIMGLVANIREAHPEETVAIISGDVRCWRACARERGISSMNPREEGVLAEGLYIIGQLGGKGLEFDDVIVDCAHMAEPDEETLKNILYVNCTRARRRLYLRYTGEPPVILHRFYPDFL